MKRPRDWIATGERETVEDEQWWCPTDARWCWCPGPCPDGTEHGPKRKRIFEGDLFVSPFGARSIRNAVEIGAAETPETP